MLRQALAEHAGAHALDAGEITQEEYEDWKDSYSPGKKVL